MLTPFEYGPNLAPLRQHKPAQSLFQPGWCMVRVCLVPAYTQHGPMQRHWTVCYVKQPAELTVVHTLPGLRPLDYTASAHGLTHDGAPPCVNAVRTILMSIREHRSLTIVIILSSSNKICHLRSSFRLPFRSCSYLPRVLAVSVPIREILLKISTEPRPYATVAEA